MFDVVVGDLDAAGDVPVADVWAVVDVVVDVAEALRDVRSVTVDDDFDGGAVDVARVDVSVVVAGDVQVVVAHPVRDERRRGGGDPGFTDVVPPAPVACDGFVDGVTFAFVEVVDVVADVVVDGVSYGVRVGWVRCEMCGVGGHGFNGAVL